MPRRTLPPRALAAATQQLSDLLHSGLPLAQALALMATQAEPSVMRPTMARLAETVRDGQSFGEALETLPEMFPPSYIRMVQASEFSGGLEQTLVRLTGLGEREAELRERILGALAYPTIVLVSAAAMGLFMILYVVPSVSLVIKESGQPLPLPTRLLLGLSGWLIRWGGMVAAGMLVGAWRFHTWHLSPQGRAAIDRFVMAVPGIGPVVRKVAIARFARTLGVMISDGLPVLEALEASAGTIANTVVREAVGRLINAVREGSALGSAIIASTHLPPFLGHLVGVGEESGTLETALVHVADIYERELNRTTRLVTTMVEPLLLVLVGGIVLCVVLAILLPVFQMGLVVQ